MQEGYFRNWLRYVGNYTEGSIRSILSNCYRVERYEGDLDKHFEDDGMNALLGWLDYSTADERMGVQQRHNVPIRGNVRSGTATLKSHTKLYWEFREYGSVGAERPPTRLHPHQAKEATLIAKRGPALPWRSGGGKPCKVASRSPLEPRGRRTGFVCSQQDSTAREGAHVDVARGVL